MPRRRPYYLRWPRFPRTQLWGSAAQKRDVNVHLQTTTPQEEGKVLVTDDTNMPVKKKSNDLFSSREIKTYLNNSIIAALRPATLGAEMPRKRLFRLSGYVSALVSEVNEHVEEGLLRPEELVLIFLASSLAVQDQIKEVGGDEANELAGASDLVRQVLEDLKLTDKKESHV